MKCNQSRPGFELVSPCPFPTTITLHHWHLQSLDVDLRVESEAMREHQRKHNITIACALPKYSDLDWMFAFHQNEYESVFWLTPKTLWKFLIGATIINAKQYIMFFPNFWWCESVQGPAFFTDSAQSISLRHIWQNLKPMKSMRETHRHHHHHVPLARISLTLSRHFSLSFIASGGSSGLHPISSHSWCMYVLASRPAFARPYVGVHRSTSLMSSSLLLWFVWFVSGLSNLDSFRDGRQVAV